MSQSPSVKRGETVIYFPPSQKDSIASNTHWHKVPEKNELIFCMEIPNNTISTAGNFPNGSLQGFHASCPINVTSVHLECHNKFHHTLEVLISPLFWRHHECGSLPFTAMHDNVIQSGLRSYGLAGVRNCTGAVQTRTNRLMHTLWLPLEALNSPVGHFHTFLLS